MRQVPCYSGAERIADGLVHGLGLAVAPIACAVLILAAKRPVEPGLATALVLYAAGLVAMIACSALYNLCREGPWKPRLRRLDHAAIFAMIAGTYTPVTLLALGGAWGWGLLGVVWTGAAGGVLFKLFAPLHYERASLVAYLSLGWAGLAALDPLFTALPGEDLQWLLAGGVLYSLGVIAYCSTRLPYHAALWHSAVLLGASCHFVVVLHLVGG